VKGEESFADDGGKQVRTLKGVDVEKLKLRPVNGATNEIKAPSELQRRGSGS
jgi:hypothetical protein